MKQRSSIRRQAALLAAFCGFLLTGCARAVSTTTVHPDGSWLRTVVFHGSAADQKGMNLGVNLKDAFALPQGAPWKVTNAKHDDEVVYTASREMHAGETLQNDVVAKASENKAPAKPILGNTVGVKQIAPGRYEYHETLHWIGKVPKELAEPDADAIQLLKKALPARLASPANVRRLSLALTHAIWREMFGPGDPLIAHISELMMQPDVITHRLGGRIATALNRTFDDLPGDKLTLQERQTLMKKLTDYVVQSGSNKAKLAQDNGGPDKSGSGDSFASLTFEVKLPGKVLKTNGEIDKLTGEVYWAVYPEAAALGDVTMQAVCDVNQQAASRR